jgi:hypothetical protein
LLKVTKAGFDRIPGLDRFRQRPPRVLLESPPQLEETLQAETKARGHQWGLGRTKEKSWTAESAEGKRQNAEEKRE